MTIKVEKAMLRNLEQIRAKNALAASGRIVRTVAKNVPSMVIANGFIGALAFAIEKKEDYLLAFQAVIDHLHKARLNCGIAATDPQAFLDELCGKSADVLRAITDESMAYLNYLRRFAKPDKGETSNGGDSAQ